MPSLNPVSRRELLRRKTGHHPEMSLRYLRSAVIATQNGAATHSPFLET
jgi:hypothetical protein